LATSVGPPSHTLPDAPATGPDLEHFVAALFQSAGYFVEKNVQEVGTLELDVVATHPDPAVNSPVLIEAKSGQWGFSDAFKVLGWMKYLKFQHGTFFCSQADPRKLAQCQARLHQLGLTFIHLDNFARATTIFTNAGFPPIQDQSRLNVWRYSYLIERQIVRALRSLKAANLGRQGLTAAVDYYNLVNDGIFFARTSEECIIALYDAYQTHPKLSLGVAREMDGQNFDAQTSDPTNARLKKAYINGDYPEIQAAFYLEHRARLAILKAASDFIEIDPQTADARAAAIVPRPPYTFLDGLQWLVQQPHRRRFPLFWQVFLWGFGGFILQDKLQDEYELLAVQCGIPTASIPAALEAFDRFFPLPSVGWMRVAGRTNARTLIMVPPLFRGLGVNVRRWCKGREYTSHYLDCTRSDLVRWNNLLYNMLMQQAPNP